jgi:hypothetical protein
MRKEAKLLKTNLQEVQDILIDSTSHGILNKKSKPRRVLKLPKNI